MASVTTKFNKCNGLFVLLWDISLINFKTSLLFLIGYYNRESRQATCLTCPLQFYCDPWETGNITGIIDPSQCRKGHYCPLGTEYSTQYPCLPGTYGDNILLKAASK